MKQWIRILVLFAGSGFVWYDVMQLCFVYSGAQEILGNPQYQSEKFINVFMSYEPLPRMAKDPYLVVKGLMIAGFFAAGVFLLINDKLKGNWLLRGLTFGFIHWALMTPWVEFYLPYNVMQEPLLLVILEAVLWLCVTLVTGLFMSFVMNFRNLYYHSST